MNAATSVAGGVAVAMRRDRGEIENLPLRATNGEHSRTYDTSEEEADSR
jgi:hypothetical protein